MKATIEAEVIIGEALARLAIGRGGVVDERQTDVYLEDLADLSPDVISRACDRLRREPRETFETALPDVGTIRSMCQTVAREDQAEAVRQRLLPPPSDEDPRTWVHCRVCQDCGWEEFWCAGEGPLRMAHLAHLTARDCQRHKAHPSHTYVRRCDCIDRNPVIARRREHDARMAHKQTSRAKRS